MNAASIIHRDVKPANILIAEESYGKSSAKRFVMIDAGAGRMRFENRQEENPRERGDIRPDLRRSRTVRNHRIWIRFWWHDQKLARRKLRRENLLHWRSPDRKIRQLLVRHDLLRFAVPQLYSETSMSSMRTSLIQTYGNDLRKWREDGAPVKGALFTQTSCDFAVLDEANMWDIVCDLCENDPRKRINVKQAAKRIK